MGDPIMLNDKPIMRFNTQHSTGETHLRHGETTTNISTLNLHGMSNKTKITISLTSVSGDTELLAQAACDLEITGETSPVRKGHYGFSTIKWSDRPTGYSRVKNYWFLSKLEKKLAVFQYAEFMQSHTDSDNESVVSDCPSLQSDTSSNSSDSEEYIDDWCEEDDWEVFED